MKLVAAMMKGNLRVCTRREESTLSTVIKSRAENVFRLDEITENGTHWTFNILLMCLCRSVYICTV